MARLWINGELYDVPDDEVEVAVSQYGATPDSSDVSPRAGGTNPLGGIAGLGAQGLEAIGGPRSLLYGAGGVAGAIGLKKLFGGRGEEAPPRAGKATAKGKGKANPRAKTRPINSGADKPRAAAPEPTENPRYTGGRGKGPTELARDAEMRARFREVAAARAGVPELPARAVGAPDPALWQTRGISAPPGKFGQFGPPAVELLLMLLNSAHADEDMQAARQQYEGVANQQRTPSLIRALQGPDVY